MPVIKYPSSNGNSYYVEDNYGNCNCLDYSILAREIDYLNSNKFTEKEIKMKVIKNNGRIFEASYSSGSYCCREVKRKFVDSSFKPSEIITLQHNCGEAIESLPSTCSCGIRISLCKCGQPTQFFDINNKSICLDCAHSLKYNYCAISGLIGECVGAYNLYGALVFVLKSRALKCKNDACDVKLTFKDYCSGCKANFYFVCGCGKKLEKAKAKDQSHKKCNDCFVPTICSPKGFMSSLRTFGLELELNIGEVKDELWKTKVDGSVNGYEFTSPIYSGGKKFHEDIERFCAFVEKKSARAGKDCGFHLHVGAEDFTHEDFVNMYENAIKIQDWHYSLLPEDRRINKFCRPLNKFSSHTKSNIDSISKFFGEYKVVNHGDNLRYRWLNFDAYNKFKTVEVRSHPGTYDADRIEKWTELWLAFVEFTKTKLEFKDPYSMMSTMGVRRSTIGFFKKKHELMRQ